MSSTVILRPGAVHSCVGRLPRFGRGMIEHGTLARCGVCGGWWHLYIGVEGSSPEWLPVRWWHLAYRRRIRQAQRGKS